MTNLHLTHSSEFVYHAINECFMTFAGYGFSRIEMDSSFKFERPQRWQQLGFLLFLLLALAMVAAFLSISPARAQIENCGAELIELVNQCVDYVFIPGPKVNPSKACCVEVCKLDVPCFCDHLPPKTEEVMSLEKAIFVARYCGKLVPHGTKCGSKKASNDLFVFFFFFWPIFCLFIASVDFPDYTVPLA